jgi:hypothetical protein
MDVPNYMVIRKYRLIKIQKVVANIYFILFLRYFLSKIDIYWSLKLYRSVAQRMRGAYSRNGAEKRTGTRITWDRTAGNRHRTVARQYGLKANHVKFDQLAPTNRRVS